MFKKNLLITASVLFSLFTFFKTTAYSETTWDISGITIGLPATTTSEKIRDIIGKNNKVSEIKRSFPLADNKKTPEYDISTFYRDRDRSIKSIYSLSKPSSTMGILRSEGFHSINEEKPSLQKIQNSFKEKFGEPNLKFEINKGKQILYYWFKDVPSDTIALIKSNKLNYIEEINNAFQSDIISLKNPNIKTGTIAFALLTPFMDDKSKVWDYTYCIIDYSELNKTNEYLKNIAKERQIQNESNQNKAIQQRTRL